MLSEQIWTDTGFNTQPPEGGWLPVRLSKKLKSCFNTQPPEGGWDALWDVAFNTFCFNTQPPEGGWLESKIFPIMNFKFQHTAARRRLGRLMCIFSPKA